MYRPNVQMKQFFFHINKTFGKFGPTVSWSLAQTYVHQTDFRHGFVEHLGRTQVAQQNVTKMTSIIVLILFPRCSANGTACSKNCKQLFVYQHLLLYRNI